MMASLTLLNLGLETALILLVLILIPVLLEGLFLWIAAKALKFKKQDFRTALVISILDMVLTLVVTLALVFISPLAGLLLWFVFFILALIYLIKKFYEATWIKALMAFSIVFGLSILASLLLSPLVLLWQLGIFGP